ncbi:DUF6682 family protein [uncultured Desulfovibrio sp.]|uniref:phage adaptor protein n=1 Tax=uncultured Desulfovibrio sp. TaxID=167968 RepID=UPI00263102E4|nr:DUF6682 family protein [uncultured Desulfovibrio sp.]
MLLAADVLRLVSGALQDLEPGMAARWPWEAEEGRIGLLDFLNAALRAVALQRPDCCAVTEVIRLEPGMLQHIPSIRRHGARHDATGFCGLVRNMGMDGEHPGAPIVSVQADVLMAWADSLPPACRVENFAYDRISNSQVYYVCPPVPDDADVYVEATYYAAPAIIKTPEQPLGVADDYAQALVHHMLASVLSGDNESSNAAKASYHMQLFSALLGTKTQVDGTWPKTGSMGGA